MSQIRAKDLTFHYTAPYVPVFEKLNLSLQTRWRIGLVGRNGRGKTTLLRLLTGELSPTAGLLHVPIPVTRFPHTPTDPDQPTRDVIRDAVAPFAAWEAELEALLASGDPDALERYGELLCTFEEHGGYDIDARIERECALMGLPSTVLNQQFSSLSGGERTRALIVALFLKPDAFPLIDEPTNHLDAEGRQKLTNYLARQSGFLLVSHDRQVLSGCVNHVLSINRADVRLHACGFADWQRLMVQEAEHEQRRHRNLQLEVGALKRAAAKRRDWSAVKEGQKHEKDPRKRERMSSDTGYIGRRAALQMKRALTIERRMAEKLDEKKTLLRNIEKERVLKLPPRPWTPAQVLTLEDVTVQPGSRPLFAPLSLIVERGERIALVGPNGVGKTSLLRLLLGQLDPSSGLCHRPANLTTGIAYQIPRWRTGRLRDHLRREGINETQFRTLMGGFGLTGTIFDQPLQTFSMGQRKKVDLCRSFLNPAQLLLWDEPLNYVDMFSRKQIEDVVKRSRPTLIFVEHDEAFVSAVATRVVHLKPA